ncbi:MAG: pyruvate:ferredoxin (flavodoxin) oxidoreductase [Phycisphaeraceae bacterium]|nr:pyruvate:ferredoxin (flavodoxin) oxidoreductase [Phycisphaeraceae bacterium]
MSQTNTAAVDANEAVASIAHRLSEVAVIYPITPSSPMGEFADEWSALGRKNIWGQVPQIMEMQSEAGAAGAVHGVLQAGSLVTTFTASQGLLLMIPNMYKIAGELLPFTMHVAARTLATHALSIFGDHGDVMAARQTGFIMLASNSPQECHDLAAVAHAATLEASLPVMHFFDGFRTSHEVGQIHTLSDDDLRAMISEEAIARFRARGMNPNKPIIRGTAQNPDVFFQTREAANPLYLKVPAIVQAAMDKLATLCGRAYKLYEYEGAADAERVIIIMGSGAETAATTAAHLNAAGEKVGVLKVRLYRPFSAELFVNALPKTVKSIAVLDRTKEPGATGEPLYLDVLTALHETGRGNVKVVGGRYGLSSKEFSPGMVVATFENLAKPEPKNHFTVGILDDVTHTSLKWDPQYDIESDDTFRAIFYGLGADGTVGANKNTIKIICDATGSYGQGYFVYDSKKSGAMTTSHLRFGPKVIRSPYLITKSKFIGCHQPFFVDRFDVLELAQPGAVFLLNSPYPADQVWNHLPADIQQKMIDLKIQFYTIDALSVARDTGMGTRINTIMQTCFFAISGILPQEEAIKYIKKAIEKTYGKKGQEVVRRNFEAVDATVANLHKVNVPNKATSTIKRPPVVPAEAPDFVQRITAQIMAGRGDLLPVSALPADGTWPTGTTKWEKRGIAAEIPIWDSSVCIQCNKCSMVCPHAAIRAKVYSADDAPEGLPCVDYKAPDLRGNKFTIQVAPDDCTGCNLCVMVCPAKNKAEPKRKAINLENRLEHLEVERANWDKFINIPQIEREKIVRIDVKGSQLLEPLFEFSGACAGCGETPYVKLMTQLFGERLMIANATGCSSIYGGNLPTTPYTVNKLGRGPAWCNSLFEDNAEFGFGMRLAVNAQRMQAEFLLKQLAPKLGDSRVQTALQCAGSTNGTAKQLEAVIKDIDAELRKMDDPAAKRLLPILDSLMPRSVWILGGDGWAYDIGYGGLDHVLAQTQNVNILVLDTEVYSNTGGQASKSTPLGASAKFANAGKMTSKKDLGLIAMSYGHVYVASVAFGAKDTQTVQAFLEAESYDGPSLIIAYSHCIAHGYDLANGLEQQKLAVDSGVWPLYRFDPRKIEKGEPALQLDSPPIKAKVSQYHANETRFRMVQKMNPARFAELEAQAERSAAARVELYKQLADIRRGAAAADKQADQN